MKKIEIAGFEKLKAQLEELLSQFSKLSGKHPDGPTNKLKLEFINELLIDANRLLKGNHKPFKSFEIFDVDSLPTNSDVAVVLSQFLSCLEGWRCEHIFYSSYDWYWKGTEIRAEPPKRSSSRSSDED